MNKTKISKIIMLILITLALVTCMSAKVYADAPSDLSGLVNSGSEETTGTEGEEDGVQDLGGEITPGTNTETPSGTVESTDDTPSDTSSENTSTYPETKIPYAGPGTTALMVTAFIACGLVGIYTFIKLSDYSNI